VSASLLPAEFRKQGEAKKAKRAKQIKSSELLLLLPPLLFLLPLSLSVKD
jgi:hypothetical protein